MSLNRIKYRCPIIKFVYCPIKALHTITLIQIKFFGFCQRKNGFIARGSLIQNISCRFTMPIKFIRGVISKISFIRKININLITLISNRTRFKRRQMITVAKNIRALLIYIVIRDDLIYIRYIIVDSFHPIREVKQIITVQLTAYICCSIETIIFICLLNQTGI